MSVIKRILAASLLTATLTASGQAQQSYYFRHSPTGVALGGASGATQPPSSGTNDAPSTPTPLSASATGNTGGGAVGTSVGDTSSLRIVPAGGKTPYTYAWTGSLPTGLTPDASGALTGTFGYAGQYGFVGTVTDAAGAQTSVPFSVEVRPPAPAVAVSTPTAVGGGALVAGFPFAANASRVAGDTLTWSLLGPSYGSIAQDGKVTGTIPDGTTSMSVAVRGTDAFSRYADASSGASAVAIPNAVPDVSSVTIQEGSNKAFSVRSNMPSPAWSLAGAPPGSAVNASGSVTVYGGDVTVDTDYDMVVTATSGGKSVPAHVPTRIQAASATLSGLKAVRSGSPFTVTLTTDMTTGGTWGLSASGTTLTTTGSYGQQNTTLSATAPTVTTGPSSVPLKATFTVSNPGQVPAPGKVEANGTLTVQPVLSFASAPANVAAVVGTSLTPTTTPSLTGKVGAVTYKLNQTTSGTTTDITTTFGTTAALCQGLTFATSTGSLSGPPAKNCSLAGVTLLASDAGSADIPVSTAPSAPFTVTVTGEPPSGHRWYRLSAINTYDNFAQGAWSLQELQMQDAGGTQLAVSSMSQTVPYDLNRFPTRYFYDGVANDGAVSIGAGKSGDVLTIDMGSPKPVARMRYYTREPYSTTNYEYQTFKTFKLETSDDNATWVSAGTVDVKANSSPTIATNPAKSTWYVLTLPAN